MFRFFNNYFDLFVCNKILKKILRTLKSVYDKTLWCDLKKKRARPKFMSSLTNSCQWNPVIISDILTTLQTSLDVKNVFCLQSDIKMHDCFLRGVSWVFVVGGASLHHVNNYNSYFISNVMARVTSSDKDYCWYIKLNDSRTASDHISCHLEKSLTSKANHPQHFDKIKQRLL